MLLSGDNLLLQMSLCSQIISGLGYFVPHGCLKQCFEMTCLLKQSPVGLPKSLLAEFLFVAWLAEKQL